MDSDRIMTDEEKKQHELKRREQRERRHRDRENKEKKTPARKLDIIDQLDATSIYGTGSMCSQRPTWWSIHLT